MRTILVLAALSLFSSPVEACHFRPLRAAIHAVRHVAPVRRAGRIVVRPVARLLGHCG